MGNYGRLKIFMWVTLHKQKIQKIVNNITANDIELNMKRVVVFNKYCPHNQVEDLVSNFMHDNKALRFFDTEYEFIINEGKFFHKVPDLD